VRGDSKEVGRFARDRGDILRQDISVCVLGAEERPGWNVGLLEFVL